MTDTEKLAAGIVQYFRANLEVDELKLLDLGTLPVEERILYLLICDAYCKTFHHAFDYSEEETTLIDAAWQLAISRKGFTPCH